MRRPPLNLPLAHLSKMCMACYGAGAPPMRAAPVPVPTAQRAPVVQFNNPYGQGWTCYPSRTGVQYVPPPPAPARARRCNPAAPPGMVSGASYVFPLKHTYVHVIMGTKVWEPNHGKFNFKMKRVPTSLSIKEFLDAITCGGGSGMACTEVVELGGGCWSKVRFQGPGRWI